MRRPALAASAACAVLLAAGARAAEENFKIPDRFNLPILERDGESLPPPELARIKGKALLKILRDPKDPRRVDAVKVLASRAARPPRASKGVYSWEPAADAEAAIDFLLEEETALPFRRWAVHRLFSSTSAEIRARITLFPEDASVDRWWNRIDKLRARASRDVDPRLAENFERYANDPLAAKWPEAKKAAGAARDRLLAARPDWKDKLAEAWKSQDNIEKGHLEALATFNAHLDAAKLSPARRAGRKAAVKSQTEHNLRVGWANMIPRIAIEAVGAAEARSYGFEAAPVRLGWPSILPR